MAAPIRDSALVVKGYKELVNAFDKAERDTRDGFFTTLKEVGEIVRVDAAARFAHYDARSAAGYRTVSLKNSVDVRQSLNKTTGDRPEYGSLQMRKALLPALDAKSGQVQAAFEQLMDRIASQDF